MDNLGRTDSGRHQLSLDDLLVANGDYGDGTASVRIKNKAIDPQKKLGCK